jgi:hypothetical protein
VRRGQSERLIAWPTILPCGTPFVRSTCMSIPTSRSKNSHSSRLQIRRQLPNRSRKKSGEIKAREKKRGRPRKRAAKTSGRGLPHGGANLPAKTWPTQDRECMAAAKAVINHVEARQALLRSRRRSDICKAPPGLLYKDLVLSAADFPCLVRML